MNFFRSANLAKKYFPYFLYGIPLLWVCYFLCTFQDGYFPRDEGGMETFGWRISQGDRLYRDIAFNKPPLSLWIHSVLQGFWGSNIEYMFYVHRLLWGVQFLLIQVLTAVSFYWISKKKVVALIPLMFAPFFCTNLFPSIWMGWDAIFFSTLAFFIGTFFITQKKSFYYLILAGFFSACALLCKQGWVFAAIGLWVYLIFSYLAHNKIKKIKSKIFAFIALYGFGGVIAIALVAMLLKKQGIDFFFWLEQMIMLPRKAIGYSLADAFVFVHWPFFGFWNVMQILLLVGIAACVWIQDKYRYRINIQLLILILLVILLRAPAMQIDFYNGWMIPLYTLSYLGQFGILFWSIKNNQKQMLGLAIFSIFVQYSTAFNFTFGAQFGYMGLLISFSTIFYFTLKVLSERSHATVIVIVLVFSSLSYWYHYHSVFKDGARNQLVNFNEPMLKGIKSHPDRVKALENMLLTVRENLHKEEDQVFFVMDNTFAYRALGKKPPSKVIIFSPAELVLEEYTKTLTSFKRNPPRVVVTDHYWDEMLNHNWGKSVSEEQLIKMNKFILKNYAFVKKIEGWSEYSRFIQDEYNVWRLK